MGYESFLGVNVWTALFTLANTVALFLVLKKFLWGPVMNMIADRQKEIDDMYAEADRAKQQAATLRSEYEVKLSAAADEAERMVKEATARGQSRQEDILRQANAEADAIRRKASADIAQEKKKAINDAKDEIAGLAVDIAGKLVGRTLDAEDQAQLVDQFIEQLGDGV